MNSILLLAVGVLALGALMIPGTTEQQAYADDDPVFTWSAPVLMNLPPSVDSAMSPVLIDLVGDPPTLPGPDTIVRRTPSELPPLGGSHVVQIEIVELQLVSTRPITVPTTGELWDVKVELGPPPFSPGTMTISKTHSNGGEYSATVPVTPKFTFSKVSDGTTVEESFDLELDIEIHPWTHFPCPDSFFPDDPIAWIVTGLNPADGISGTLNQNPLPNDSCIVGGKTIPIQSTALIVAGAQSYSWMIPLMISAIGIGLFIVSRKSENS